MNVKPSYLLTMGMVEWTQAFGGTRYFLPRSDFLILDQRTPIHTHNAAIAGFKIFKGCQEGKTKQ